MSARFEGHRDCHQARREDFLQLIGYVLLDYDASYRITQMGVHLTRLSAQITWTLSEYLDLLGHADPGRAARGVLSHSRHLTTKCESRPRRTSQVVESLLRRRGLRAGLQAALPGLHLAEEGLPLVGAEDQRWAFPMLRVPHRHDSRQIPGDLDASAAVIAAGALTPHGTGEVYLWSSHPAPPHIRWSGQAGAYC
jgi:hypothetical protein